MCTYKWVLLVTLLNLSVYPFNALHLAGGDKTIYNGRLHTMAVGAKTQVVLIQVLHNIMQ